MSKIKRHLKDHKGFTLIELMIVVVILGILAAAIVPGFTNSADKAKIATAKSDLSNFKTVLLMVYAQDGSYPSDSTVWSDLRSEGYLPGTGSAAPQDPWESDYTYSTTGTTFEISTGGATPAITVTESTNPQ